MPLSVTQKLDILIDRTFHRQSYVYPSAANPAVAVLFPQLNSQPCETHTRHWGTNGIGCFTTLNLYRQGGLLRGGHSAIPEICVFALPQMTDGEATSQLVAS